MNFSLQQPGGTAPTPPSTQGLPPRGRAGNRRKGGLKTPLILTALAVGGGVVAFTSVPGLGKSVTGLFSSGDTSIIKYKVTRTKLPVVVVERGSLESSKNLDGINEVEGMTTIIKIVPEGSTVKKDDIVCTLDSATLKDNLINQKLATTKAETDLEQAKKNLEVAEIAVKEYLEGTFPTDKQTAEGSIKLAESELIKAQDRLEWSNRMTKIGYVAASQNQSDKLAMDKARYTLEQSERQLKVLNEFTKKKQMTELQANVEKARSDMLAKQQTYELEKAKEDKLEKQITKTVLKAPNDGLVVYANETGRFGGSNQPMIEEGAQVRERQKIFSLPDITKMRVNTKVHESMVDKVTPGLYARIIVDAFPNQPLVGKVESVQPLPDPSSFFNSDVKVYTTLVAIQNGHPGLRPGMTAQVEILVTQLPDVLTVPIQSILEFKGKDHVYVVAPDGSAKRREIKLGISNEKFVEVKEGIKEGEFVAMNPGSLMTEAEKREAFAGAKDGANKKEWSADAVKAGVSPGMLPAGGGDGAPKKDAAKKKGGRGGMMNNPAMQKLRSLTEKLSPEDQEKVKNFTTPMEEREALYKKAGATDEDIAAWKAFMAQMMEMRKNGGGGFGGPGGGGPGGGGGFGGGGPRGGGEGGGQPQ